MLALNLVQRAIEWNAGNFLLWLEMARCQQELGLVSMAETSYAQVQQLNPDCREAHIALSKLSQAGVLARTRGWLNGLFKR